MNINFIVLGEQLKKQDAFFSKQQQFLFLYQLVKQHH
jgi:hypothetical protein